MELLPLLFMSLCLLTLSRLTFGDQSVTSVTVKEDDDAILPCSLGTNENIESKLFDWKKEETVNVFLYKPDNNPRSNPGDNFKGRVSHFPGELEHGNASIKIIKTRLEDKGNYTCLFLDNRKKFRVELVVEAVLKVRNVPGAAEPSVTNLNQTNDWALLRCDVKGASPKPTVEWWHSNNTIIHSEDPQVSKQGDRFYITLKATVKKTDNYSCVAKQEEINHQAQKEIYVYFYEGVGSHSPVPKGLKQAWRRSRPQTSIGPEFENPRRTIGGASVSPSWEELRRAPDEGSPSTRSAEATGGCSNVPACSAGSQLCQSGPSPRPRGPRAPSPLKGPD